jgi:transposase
VGRGIRNPSESWAASRQRACCRFHHHPGAPACSRRKRGNQNQEALGRSRGGFSTKIHLRTNAKGDPLTFDLAGGEAHEVKGYDALMELHDIIPDRLLGDKGYDSDDIRNDLADRGIEPVIPPRSNRKTPIEYDREAYKRRNLIERCVNRLKQFRLIATRHEKTARAYLSMLCIAAASQHGLVLRSTSDGLLVALTFDNNPRSTGDACHAAAMRAFSFCMASGFRS